MSNEQSLTPSWRGLIKLWFLVDVIVALAPPLYWAMDGDMTPVVGVPAALFYFLAVNAFITLSLVVAYLVDPADGESAA
jgi:hypothetical protein